MDWPVCGEINCFERVGVCKIPEGIYLEILIGFYCSVKICCFSLFSHRHLNCTNRWRESNKTGQDKLEGLML